MSSDVHRFRLDKSGKRDIAANDGDVAAVERPRLEPIDTSFSYKNKAYAALKTVIVGMDVYGSRNEIRLDERSLAEEFGISRTPVREAMAQLEREGFVRAVPLYACAALGVVVVIGLFTYLPAAQPESARELAMAPPRAIPTICRPILAEACSSSAAVGLLASIPGQTRTIRPSTLTPAFSRPATDR